MSFRTEIKLSPYEWSINHQDKIFSIGSCFAEAMGKRFSESKFQVSTPFGTIFNPISIFRLLRISSQIEKIDEHLFIKNHEEIAYHYDFHSSWRTQEIDLLRKNIEEKLADITDFFQESKYLFITLGTAWVYELSASQRIVANCHKMPATIFNKRLLSVEEIIEDFEKLQSCVSSKKIIFTVSPVRHLKDTLPLNTVSKSVLRLACHYLQEKYANVYYFPAFELINDDLRDYRFYTEDMLHINSQGEEYIWNKLIESCVSPKSREIIAKWKKIANRLGHQFFNKQTPTHRDFLQETLLELESISAKTDVSEEIKAIRKALLNF